MDCHRERGAIMVYWWNSKHDNSKDLLDNQCARRPFIGAVAQCIVPHDTEFRNRYLSDNFNRFSAHPRADDNNDIAIAEGTKELSGSKVQQLSELMPCDASGGGGVQLSDEVAPCRRNKSVILVGMVSAVKAGRH